MFREMSLAMHKLSMRELATCSPRRLLTNVLTEPGGTVFKLSFSELDKLCDSATLSGTVRIHLRIDSAVNDRLREFRDHAERQIGRSVSVLEAINACIYAVNKQ